MVGSTPVPSREFDFGMAGDKPVGQGDFNRDGRTDVGVVRGGVSNTVELVIVLM